MNTPDINAQLERAFPLCQLAAAVVCRSRGVDAEPTADELAWDTLSRFWERYVAHPEQYGPFLDTPALAFSVFRQIARALLSEKWQQETRAESLDAQEIETALAEIEWGNVTRRVRGKRAAYVPYVATGDDVVSLCERLARQSRGELDAIDIADAIGGNWLLTMWLSGFSEREIGHRTQLKAAIASVIATL